MASIEERLAGSKERSSGFLPDSVLDSILAAIEQEVIEGKNAVNTRSLEIDGIRHLRNSGGRFVYRLMLSSPVNFSPEQVLQFQCSSTKESVTATVLVCDDEGLVIETEQPLATDVTLLNVTFDPAFIYKALGEYLSHAAPTPIAKQFFRRTLPPIPELRQSQRSGLNHEQSLAIEEMTAVPIHLLWGPPGTGKTTTLGVAICEWMRQGLSVLVVSNSNAAVDVSMRAILKRVDPKERNCLLRLGTSLDQQVGEITMSGKLRNVDHKAVTDARAAQDRLTELSEVLSHRTISNQRFQELWAEYSRLEGVISRANERATALLPSVLPNVRILGCTLAKMVLDETVHGRTFDIVVIDEVSMVSVAYAIAASTLATSHFVLAGDPKQLPPICQSSQPDAQKWFGVSCYDWFDVGRLNDGVDTTQFSVLRTQYRMTNAIGGVVSRLSYGNILQHGRGEEGELVEFVDVADEWQTTYYSVRERSYFHLSSIPIIHEIADVLAEHKEVLLVSPFRPQRSLLAALAFDLHERFPRMQVTASTIHRSQGSESRAVVVDLTTHRPDRLVAFFRDKDCANLFNVGISRAQDLLIIIGSRSMLHMLAKETAFWGGFLRELGHQINYLPVSELLDDPVDASALKEIVTGSSRNDSPALYAHPDGEDSLNSLATLLRNVGAKRKLLVLPGYEQPVDTDGLVVRHSNTPAVFMANGYVAIPYKHNWLPVFSPNVARVVWRIGFSHLAEDEVNPMQAKRFFCPECATGQLNLKRVTGEGWFLTCSNNSSFECPYRRRLSLEDAKLKVRITGMTCPSGHPLTARMGGKRYFLACENYPECDYTGNLSLLEGV